MQVNHLFQTYGRGKLYRDRLFKGKFNQGPFPGNLYGGGGGMLACPVLPGVGL